MSTHNTLHHILKRLILPLVVAALALGGLPAVGNSSGSGAKHEGKQKSGKEGHADDKSDKHGDDDKSSGKRRHDDEDDKSDKPGKPDDEDDKSDKPGKPDDDDDKPGKPTAPTTAGPTGAPAAPGASGTAGPPTQPAPQPPSLEVRGTSQRSCASVRSFSIRLRENSKQRLRWARVKVNGKTVKVLRGDRLRARVNLSGLPKGRFHVRIVAMTTTGKRVSAVRAYRTCTKKQARKYKGKV
jgi:hypothetical protein